MSERPVAVITMATGYVGPELARTLAGRGFDLVLEGRGGDSQMVGIEEPLAEQVPQLEALGAAVELVTDADLMTREGNQAVIERAMDRFGRLDSVCLVTGVIIVGRFLDMTEQQWDQIKRTNLDMVFHGL